MQKKKTSVALIEFRARCASIEGGRGVKNLGFDDPPREFRFLIFFPSTSGGLRFFKGVKVGLADDTREKNIRFFERIYM